MGDEKSYRNAKTASSTARSNARSLRKRMTPPERALWVALRGRKVAGLKFRRQAPIGPYIADFYCHEARLVVEIDGSTHQGSQAAHDRDRDQWMRDRGMSVLRVSGRDVLQNLEGVVRTIARVAGEPPPSR
ncbi:MAG: endonuclease domain-containing protein [Phycisphaerales bacterium]